MSEWISVEERLPVTPGGFTRKPVWVAAQEFGQPWVFAVARCWISIDTPLFPVWYFDSDFYHLDCPMHISEPVYYWMPLPPLPAPPAPRNPLA